MLYKNIILIGPSSTRGKFNYGGGVGGYLSNLIRYKEMLDKKFDVQVYQISTRNSRSKFLAYINFPIRFFSDILGFLVIILKSSSNGKKSIIHILGQYRDSLYREIFFVFIASFFSYPIVYDIRAGSFITSYKSRGPLYKILIKELVKKSNSILVESRRYSDFLLEEFKKESYYIPNFVSNDLVNSSSLINNSSLIDSNIINILFVGYAYKYKGIYQMMEACKILNNTNLKVKLHLAGSIQEDVYKSNLFQQLKNKEIIIEHGVLRNNRVYELMSKSSIYLYPSMHPGEGHNNSVNEAACHALPMIISQNGFLTELFDDTEAYFLTNLINIQPNEIVSKVKEISKDVNAAMKRAEKARKKVYSKYSADAVLSSLLKAYLNSTKLFIK